MLGVRSFKSGVSVGVWLSFCFVVGSQFIGLARVAGEFVDFSLTFIVFFVSAYLAEGYIRKSSSLAEFTSGISAGTMISVLSMLIARILIQSLVRS